MSLWRLRGLVGAVAVVGAVTVLGPATLFASAYWKPDDVAKGDEFRWLPRYPRSCFFGFLQRRMDEARIPLAGESGAAEFGESADYAGPWAKFTYAGAERTSSFEIYAHYKKTLEDAGFKVLWDDRRVQEKAGYATASKAPAALKWVAATFDSVWVGHRMYTNVRGLTARNEDVNGGPLFVTVVTGEQAEQAVAHVFVSAYTDLQDLAKKPEPVVPTPTPAVTPVVAAPPTPTAAPSTAPAPARRVALYVLGRGADGSFVDPTRLRGLKPRVLEDGRDVGEVRVDPADEQPSRFGIVMDVSGSMADAEKMDRARDAALTLVDAMRSGDRAFLVTFASTVRRVVPFTSDRSRLREAIRNLEPYGATALYDGMAEAQEQFDADEGRAVLVVLTDGLDQNPDRTGPGSRRTLKDVLVAARRREVQIHTVGLGPELQQQKAFGLRVLRKVAETTGAGFYYAPGAAQLKGIFDEIVKAHNSQAKLTFAPPSGGGDGKWHTLEVKLPPAGAGVALTYKNGYQAE